MSIIHEALKKAEKSSVQQSAAPLYTPQRDLSPKQAMAHSKSFNWGPLFILLVLVLIVGPLTAPFFATHLKKGPVPARGPQDFAQFTEPVSEAVTDSSETRQAQFGMENMPLPASTPTGMIMPSETPLPIIEKAPTPALKLTGLVWDPKASYCLINNKIVKVGDSVDGARVMRIDANEVELEADGQKVILTLYN